MMAGVATSAMMTRASLCHAVSLPLPSLKGLVTFQADYSASPRSAILGQRVLDREPQCWRCCSGPGSKLDLRASYGHLKCC